MPKYWIVDGVVIHLRAVCESALVPILGEYKCSAACSRRELCGGPDGGTCSGCHV